ncbi:MAG: bifunctional glutamate N-acetyltransferase/amino-acid acetyltransferase ArgJ [Acidimicrobiia bacterium]
MSVTAPKGFVAAGTACGLKGGGAPDLALVATTAGRAVPAAGVFTTNRVAAAPVVVSRGHLDDPHAAAVVLNSGNANAATGAAGRTAALATADAVADSIGVDPTDVLVCSTGLIGIPFPADVVVRAVPGLTAALDDTPEAGAVAAGAILTTDTVSKEAVAGVQIGGRAVTVGGMAKGAGMLAPAHATMLAVLTTDAVVGPGDLQAMLAGAVDVTFDRMTVDGAQSTNDTVLVLASGDAGGGEITAGSADGRALAGAVEAVCSSLAEQMARDAEGATKVVHVTVTGASDDGQALRAARQVAESQLVKCSWYGENAYWGRVLSELGVSGADLDPEAVDISYGGITVCRDGVAAVHDEAAVDAVMSAAEIEIDCDLHHGSGTATVLTTDLSHAYVDENMGKS